MLGDDHRPHGPHRPTQAPEPHLEDDLNPDLPGSAAVAVRTVVAVIPARGGSKGVPLKNLEAVGGRSLVARAVDSVLGAPSVTLAVVSTDDDRIAAEARAAGARVVVRPPELSGDEASSESAVLHALDELVRDGTDPEVTVLVQATSPFIDSAALDVAVRRVLDGSDDVVLAAAPTHAFTWKLDGTQAVAVGHDAATRPRRQDREPIYRETGAFYAMRTSGLRSSGHRFFGRTGLQVVDEESSLEIDTPADLRLARTLATAAPTGYLDVDALVTDFDGVHTDDRAYVDADGRELVSVTRADGLGVARLRDAGVPVLILSTETNPVVGARARKLRVECLQGVTDKAVTLRRWMAEHDLDPARVAYVGNDVNDLPALALVGWPVAVADARPPVLDAARLVLDTRGGAGAVREITDLILAARGRST